jgi:hypothetical protein
VQGALRWMRRRVAAVALALVALARYAIDGGSIDAALAEGRRVSGIGLSLSTSREGGSGAGRQAIRRAVIARTEGRRRQFQ